MRKKLLYMMFVFVLIIFFGCNRISSNNEIDSNNTKNTTLGKINKTKDANTLKVDGNNIVKSNNEDINKKQDIIRLQDTKPNEAGKIMIVMFHNFVNEFTPTHSDNGEYTTTFGEFSKLISILYDKGYRLISLDNYLNNNISIKAGLMPIILTFDDGTSGQFNLIEERGSLVANAQSAVGILEEFNKKHPDFDLKGVFYVNLKLKTFDGKGTIKERLKYLINEGFEIGNHTMNHTDLSSLKSIDSIETEVGGNQKLMFDFVPRYDMKSLALPFGIHSKNFETYIEKGIYNGISYKNLAIMEVGWDPTFSPVNKKFNPLTTHRIRATGYKEVSTDLNWWLKNLSKSDNM